MQRIVEKILRWSTTGLERGEEIEAQDLSSLLLLVQNLERRTEELRTRRARSLVIDGASAHSPGTHSPGERFEINSIRSIQRAIRSFYSMLRPEDVFMYPRNWKDPLRPMKED